MQARKSINALATFSAALAHPASVRLGPKAAAAKGALGGAGGARPKVPSPCFAMGTSKVANVVVPGIEGEVEVELVGAPGGFTACKRLVEVMMNKDACVSSHLLALPFSLLTPLTVVPAPKRPVPSQACINPAS